MAKSFQIKDFPDYYATDTGDIYSRQDRWKRIRKLKPAKSPAGYLRVLLHKDGKRFNKFVHRLVAETFIPNPENKPFINHLNGNKEDNRIQNLSWCSTSENVKHSYDVLHRKHSQPMLGRFGKDNKKSHIVLQLQDNKVINYFYGIGEANRKTGIQFKNISAVCRGKRKSAGGFQWKYKEESDKITMCKKQNN